MSKWPGPAHILVLAIGFAFFFTSGCQTTESRKPATATQPVATRPTDAMTSYDAERAKASIARDREEQSSERRPYQPPPPPVVDQPRPTGRR